MLDRGHTAAGHRELCDVYVTTSCSKPTRLHDGHACGRTGQAQPKVLAAPRLRISCCVATVLKRRMQTRQLIVPAWRARSHQECGASFGNANHWIVWHHERNTCSYVTGGARRALPSMLSLTVCIMQTGAGPFCYSRFAAAAAAGHSQHHGVSCVQHSFLVAADSVAACATPGPARPPSPCRETRALLMGSVRWGERGRQHMSFVAIGMLWIHIIRRLVIHRGACRFAARPKLQCVGVWGQSHMLGVGAVGHDHCCQPTPLVRP